MKHKNIQIKPCNIGWHAMDVHEDDNRFCLSCSKVVHDMSEMTESEAEAFLDANPGSCGNFLAWQVDTVTPEHINLPKAKKRSTWKKAAAAAAALALLHGNMPADVLNTDLQQKTIERLASDPSRSNPDPIGPSTNTLLTGVLVSDGGHEIRDPLTIHISCGKKLIDFEIVVENGLFAIDLSEKLAPSDQIEILIPEQSHRYNKYPNTKFKTSLGEGQNLNIPIAVQYAKRLGGVMIRRD